ncbi:MAG: hypothetical protein KME30_21205 [Iphinoe sp. HA4291-MV1]|jgi:hypothetical protein|nr:hypothetical protein [Iphinoe sp. HA4291-MV1]
MRLPSKVQISDLKSTESFVEEELTLEEAEKIVGGFFDFHAWPPNHHAWSGDGYIGSNYSYKNDQCGDDGLPHWPPNKLSV